MTNIEKFEAAATSPKYAYHRFESWRTGGEVKDPSDLICRIYLHDETSPSGRILGAALNDAEKAEEILIEHGRIK